MQSTITSLNIIIPIYNDWDAVKVLISRIGSAVTSNIKQIAILLVNDGSTILPPEKLSINNLKIEIVNLNRNLGHQKAISIGLAYLASQNSIYDAVIVMDADGEDRPEAIPMLVNTLQKKPDNIIFARRGKRFQGWWFKFFYSIYRNIFMALTGKSMPFGNFCIIPASMMKKLTHVSEIWNHFSGGVLRSNIKYSTIQINRGTRIAGKSKMNLISLILHGLSAISVYADIVAVRMLIMTFLLIVMSLIGLGIVAYHKLISHMAIPGWASSMLLGLIGILVQSILLSLFLTFTILSYRMQKLFIPAIHYKNYIDSIESK